MDLIKIAEEAFATGKQHPDFGPATPSQSLTASRRVTRNVSSNIAVWLSASQAKAKRSASQFAR